MKYVVRVQNPCSPDLVLTEVDADSIGDVVNTYSGKYATIIITQEKDSKKEGASPCK